MISTCLPWTRQGHRLKMEDWIPVVAQPNRGVGGFTSNRLFSVSFIIFSTWSNKTPRLFDYVWLLFFLISTLSVLVHNNQFRLKAYSKHHWPKWWHPMFWNNSQLMAVWCLWLVVKTNPRNLQKKKGDHYFGDLPRRRLYHQTEAPKNLVSDHSQPCIAVWRHARQKLLLLRPRFDLGSFQLLCGDFKPFEALATWWFPESASELTFILC